MTKTTIYVIKDKKVHKEKHEYPKGHRAIFECEMDQRKDISFWSRDSEQCNKVLLHPDLE